MTDNVMQVLALLRCYDNKHSSWVTSRQVCDDCVSFVNTPDQKAYADTLREKGVFSTVEVNPACFGG